MNSSSPIIKNKRLAAILVTAISLLSVPLIAMLFTTEVDWKLPDFIIMGILLLGSGLACEWILRKVKRTWYRVLICVGVLMAFLLVWAELAVGLLGSPFAGN